MTVFGLSLLTGCSTMGGTQDKGFTYTDIPVTYETAYPGEGNHILFRDKELPLSGEGIQIGDSLRSAQVTKSDLSLSTLTGPNNTIRIINIVPSLDTKVCEQQTHYLSEKNHGLDQQISLITISIDTPFAQTRFAEEANIDNVVFLSDYRGAEFGKNHGLLLEGPHVLARAVMVVDQDNILRYMQVTPDLGQLPDMEAAFQEARRLLDTPS
ncbi:thiol peroxidase [Nitrospira sp. M1]